MLHHDAQEFPLGYIAHSPRQNAARPPNIVGVQKYSSASLRSPCAFTHPFNLNKSPALKYAPSQSQTHSVSSTAGPRDGFMYPLDSPWEVLPGIG